MKNQTCVHIPVAKYGFLLWIAAFILTIASAVFQRSTGPTYPVKGEVSIQGTPIRYRFLRSETVGTDAKVSIQVPDTTVTGFVKYRRLNSSDEWTAVDFSREENTLVAFLPEQPPAGKLIYYVTLTGKDGPVSVTGDKPVILRYKGDVPGWILLPHIVLMFLAMLLSNRAGLEALDRNGHYYRYLVWTIGLFFVGGFVLGPLMQKYAFGAYWTGIPLGTDLTDNKTLIAMLGWIWAWFKNRKGKAGRGWVIFAFVLMLAIYLIPHSLLGSELDYTQQPMR